MWSGLSFKEHMEMNTHWEFEGLLPTKGKEEILKNGIMTRRFLMFCDKETKTWLKDVKTGEIFEVPLGAQAKGRQLALDILNLEK